MKKEISISGLHFDDRITENIYFVNSSEKVMKNISSRQINIQIPINKTDIGVRHSKRDDILVSTLCIVKGKKRHLFQFIILKGCNKNEVYQREFNSFKGLESIIIQGIDIVNVETLQDLFDMSIG